MKPDGHLSGLHGVLGGRDRPAAVVPEDHDQRHAEDADAVFERAEHGVVDHLAGGADHEGVPEAEVEDDLSGQPGIRAAEDHRERVLVLHEGGAARRVLVGVGRFAGNKAFVAFAQTAPGKCGGEISGHGRYFTAKGRGRVKLLRPRAAGDGPAAADCSPGLHDGGGQHREFVQLGGAGQDDGGAAASASTMLFSPLPVSRSSQSRPPALRVPVTGALFTCCRSQVGLDCRVCTRPMKDSLGVR